MFSYVITNLEKSFTRTLVGPEQVNFSNGKQSEVSVVNVIISYTLHYGSCQDALVDSVGIYGRRCLIMAVIMLLYGFEYWNLKERHENVIRYSGHKTCDVDCGINII
jgi:hypothetical protein